MSPLEEDRRAQFDALARTLSIPPGDATGATIRGTPVGEPGPVQDGEVELVRLLSEGGMGAVWIARQGGLDREVAVKRAREAHVQAALVDEGRTTGSLEHPGIVPVHALAHDEAGAPMLVMKRIDGVTLQALARDPAHAAWPALEQRHGDRLTAIIEILMRVADALAFTHARGYVHRDVKPENIMVGAFGEVYLLDFGIAARPDPARAGEAISLVGTPAFMAPEMVRGLVDAVDARTDVYLLGATLWGAITGRPRHEGSTIHMVLHAAWLSDPPPPHPALPEELHALVVRATAADPAARPPTALAFRDALAEFLRHRGSLRQTMEVEDRLEALRGGAEQPPRERLLRGEAQRTLLECRFALGQALRDHPGNERARRALRTTLRWLARTELERRSPDAAETFLAELDEPAPELRALAAAVRASLAEAQQLEEAARAEAYERDPLVAMKPRLILIGVLLAIGSAVTAIATYARPDAPEGAAALVREELLSAIVNAVIFSAVCGGVYAFRRRLLVNRVARQIAAVVIVGGAITVAANACAVVLGPSAAHASTVYVSLCLAGSLLGASIAVGRMAILASLPLFAACAATLRWPPLGPKLLGASFVAALTLAGLDTLITARGRR